MPYQFQNTHTYMYVKKKLQAECMMNQGSFPERAKLLSTATIPVPGPKK
jgi:hypothetical protein